MNIRKIAKKSGVSTATVSRVLNNSSRVHPDTRKKVLEIVDASNFKLRNTNRKNFTIGVNVPSVSTSQLNHNFVCEFITGIAESLSKLQASIKIIDTNELLLIPEKTGAYNDYCKEKGINAIVHILAPISLHSCIERIADDGISQIVFEHQFNRPDISWVDVENFDTSCNLAKNLVQLGVHDFAIVTAGRTFKGHYDRYKGFIKGLKEHGLEIPSYWDIERRHINVEAGVSATLSLLASSKKSPRVIYFTNAELALGGVKTLLNHGLKLPEDVIVAFFDDSSFTNWFPVPVASLRQPAYEIGVKTGSFFLPNILERPSHAILTPELFIGYEIVKSLEAKSKVNSGDS